MQRCTLRSISFCLGLLGGIGVLAGAAALRAEEPPPFQQVHCLKYAEGRAPIEAFARGAKPAGEIDVPMVICVARRPGQVVVLDAGYVDEAFGAAWGITTWTDLTERLGELGVSPEQVDLVTISHLHWDHSGGTSRFPKARFVMQRRELEYAALDLPGNPFVKDGFRIDETLDAIRLKWDGRLDLVDGDAEGWQPGLDLYLTPGHTAGTMMVCLATVQGRVCYSSDAVYLYRNLAENLPLGLAVLPSEVFESYQKIRRLLRGGRLVPGHDMEIFTAAEKHGFRRVSDRVVAIVE
jgi:glyoxylase-like metal-dependent hydrolase (beta-lactamase superfamily II)